MTKLIYSISTSPDFLKKYRKNPMFNRRGGGNIMSTIFNNSTEDTTSVTVLNKLKLEHTKPKTDLYNLLKQLSGIDIKVVFDEEFPENVKMLTCTQKMKNNTSAR